MFFTELFMHWASISFRCNALTGPKPTNTESVQVLDLPTAFAFFGANPKGSLTKIRDSAKTVCSQWNELFSDPQASVHYIFLLIEVSTNK